MLSGAQEVTLAVLLTSLAVGPEEKIWGLTTKNESS